MPSTFLPHEHATAPMGIFEGQPKVIMVGCKGGTTLLTGTITSFFGKKRAVFKENALFKFFAVSLAIH